MDQLYKLIGPYKVYSDKQRGIDYVTEDEMKRLVIKKFGKLKFALSEAL